MISERCEQSIVDHEGAVVDGEGLHHAYLEDGKLHIGYGCLLDEQFTISESVARQLLHAEMEEKAEQLRHVHGFLESDALRRDVILELAYWIGVAGVLRFREFWKAVCRQDWLRAGAELRDSATYRNPNRRPRMETLAGRMETGTW